MEQYINKSAVIAEIDVIQDDTMDENRNFLSSYHEGIFDGLSKIENFLDTIETKEVDLVKEINEYMDIHGLHTQDGGRIVFANGDTTNFLCDFRDIAKHFFELGLKEQKGWSPKNAIAIEGICSDKDFIDTNHGILAFGEEEGSYRPFNDGDKVKIIIIRKE